MKRWIHASTEDWSEDTYLSYDEAEYEEGFMDIENQVIEELGLYIDFSGVRFNSGPIWIFSDPDHKNNSDMWMGDLDDALVKLDFSEYVSDVETEVLTKDKSKWESKYREYLQSLIQGGKE